MGIPNGKIFDAGIRRELQPWQSNRERWVHRLIQPSDLDEDLRLDDSYHELVDLEGALGEGLDPSEVAKGIEKLKTDYRNQQIKRSRVVRWAKWKQAKGEDGDGEVADAIVDLKQIDADLFQRTLEYEILAESAKLTRTGNPTLDRFVPESQANFTPSTSSGDYGRGGLGSGSPYGKGESFSGSSSSPFTAGNDTSGAGNPYAVGGTPGYGDQQAGSNNARTSYGGSVQAGAGAPGYDDAQAGAAAPGYDDEQANAADTQSEREKQSGSGSGPDPEGNQGDAGDAGTPTYEGNEKGWVSAQTLNRLFQLIDGGNGARGTPGGIRNDAQQPGPSISGFSGVSNPLAPYIRTTDDEPTRRFGGPRGGKRGVDPRNIRSDGPGYGGNEQATDRYIDLSGLGPIAPNPNARNPFETSGSVASKNRR